MNTAFASICVLVAALTSHAQQTGADETLGELSKSASQQLAGSIQQLNSLREQIVQEKLPLAEELTALEESLAQLRKDHERVAKLVDAGNIEIFTLTSEVKVRQDELSYIANILDEYSRTFESKVNICELQYCGEAVETAKLATENTTLTMDEKFLRQIAFTNVSVRRLFDAIGGMTFPGVGVNEQDTVVEGQYAILGPVAIFRETNGAAAGLVVPRTDSDKPLIRPLEGAAQAGLVSLVQNGEGLMPLDPSRGGALKAMIQKFNLIHVFEKGGPIMWPLLVASILALGVVLERVLFLMREKMRRDPKAVGRFFAAVTQGNLAEAIKISKASKFYVVRALGYALAHKETSLESALLYAQAQELKRFRRGVPILDTVITLAPLLGLLGTVTGMMGSFSLIGGELSSPGAITGGIAEALIATAFGLGIAITALLPFNFLNARLDEARHEMESAATQLELIVHTAPTFPPSKDNGAVTPPRAAQDSRLSHPPADAANSHTRQSDLHRKRQDIERQLADLQSEIDQQNRVIDEAVARQQPVKEGA
jgi:biopolymer transport protein ExbB